MIMPVICARAQGDEVGVWLRTSQLATNEFCAYVHGSMGTITVDTAVASTPHLSSESCAALLEALTSASADLADVELRGRAHMFDVPWELGHGRLVGVYRIDLRITLQGGMETRPDAAVELCFDEIVRPSFARASTLADARGDRGPPLTSFDYPVALREVVRAGARRQYGDSQLAQNLSAIALIAPSAPTPRHVTHGDDYPDRGASDVPAYDGARSYRRELWAKGAVEDIRLHVPDWPPGLSIQAYHRLLMLALHTPGVSTKLPLLVQERNAYSTYLQAILLKHQDNPIIAGQLSDPVAAETLSYRLSGTFDDGAGDLEECKRDPEDTVKQLRVVNHVAIALGEVRGVVEGSNRRSVLMQEAAALLDTVKSASTAEGEVEFLCQVNTLVQSCFQRWQSVQLDQLATTSSLARLIPDVVARLSSSAQERTLAFFNDVVRTFQADSAQATLPLKFKNRFNEALREYTSAVPASASFRGLGLADRGVGSAAYEAMGTLERASNPSARRLAAVSDLHCIAPAGLLESHFGLWVGRMAGGHVRLPRSALGLLAMRDADTDGDDAPGGGGESIMAVTTPRGRPPPQARGRVPPPASGVDARLSAMERSIKDLKEDHRRAAERASDSSAHGYRTLEKILKKHRRLRHRSEAR